MKTIRNTPETVKKYNQHQDELYRIETFYNNKIYELTSIAISVFKKSFGKNTHGYFMKEVLENRGLEWLFYTDTIRASYWFRIESITDKQIKVAMRKRTFSKQKWEEVVVKIPQGFLHISDRDFAKLIRQEIKEYKYKETQRILQNFEKFLNNELTSLKHYNLQLIICII